MAQTQTAGEMLEVMENSRLDEDADRERFETALRRLKEAQDALWMRNKYHKLDMDGNSQMIKLDAHDAAFNIVESIGEAIELVTDQLATYEGEM